MSPATMETLQGQYRHYQRLHRVWVHGIWFESGVNTITVGQKDFYLTDGPTELDSTTSITQRSH